MEPRQKRVGEHSFPYPSIGWKRLSPLTHVWYKTQPSPYVLANNKLKFLQWTAESRFFFLTFLCIIPIFRYEYILSPVPGELLIRNTIPADSWFCSDEEMRDRSGRAIVPPLGQSARESSTSMEKKR